MKYCPYCGSNLDEDMAFCPLCGKQYKTAAGNEILEGEQQNAVPRITPVSHIQASTTNTESSTDARKRNVYHKFWIAAIIFIVSAIVVISVLVLNESAAFSKNTRKINQAAESVVMITCYDNFGAVRCTGSGFFLYDDETVITNYHVIDRAIDATISTNEDHTFHVESVLAYDVNKDIAILKVSEATGLQPLTIGSSKDIPKGSTVVAIGSPLGNKNMISAGILSGRWYNSSSRVDELQFSAPISSGSSGGALFSDSGDVIGITSASFEDGQNMNLAIPIEEVDACHDKLNPMSVIDCFKKEYSVGATTYLSSSYVEINELILKPDTYAGQKISTMAYLIPVDKKTNAVSLIEYLAFESEEAAISADVNNQLSYVRCYLNIPHNDYYSDYYGYALICGELHFFPGADNQESALPYDSALNSLLDPMISMQVRYIEE